MPAVLGAERAAAARAGAERAAGQERGTVGTVHAESGLRPSRTRLLVPTGNAMIAMRRETTMLDTPGGKSAGLDSDGLHRVPVTEALVGRQLFASDSDFYNGIPKPGRRLGPTVPFLVGIPDATLPAQLGPYTAHTYSTEGVAVAHTNPGERVEHDGVQFQQGAHILEPTSAISPRAGEPSLLEKIQAAWQASHKPLTRDRYRGMELTQGNEYAALSEIDKLSMRKPTDLHLRSIRDPLPVPPDVVEAAITLRNGQQKVDHTQIVNAQLTRIAATHPGIAEAAIEPNRYVGRLDSRSLLLASAREAADQQVQTDRIADHQSAMGLTLLINDLRGREEYQGASLATLYKTAQEIMAARAAGSRLDTHHAESIQQAQLDGAAIATAEAGVAPTVTPAEAIASSLTSQGEREIALVDKYFIGDSVMLGIDFGMRIVIQEILAARNKEYSRIHREHGTDSQAVAENLPANGQPQTVVTMAELKDKVRKKTAAATRRPRQAARRLVAAASGLIK